MLHDALGFVAASNHRVFCSGVQLPHQLHLNIVPASFIMTAPTTVQAPLEVMLASSSTAEGHAEHGHHGIDVEAQRQRAAGPLPAGTDEDAASKSPLLEEEAAIAVADASCLAPGPVSLQAAGSGTDNTPWWEGDNPGELMGELADVICKTCNRQSSNMSPLQRSPWRWTCT